ncbi:hypothetical protein P1X16_20545 [Hymenobacter sp. YC55]|nr:hypothetical protein [Hymenobacter sp. YC55]
MTDVLIKSFLKLAATVPENPEDKPRGRVARRPRRLCAAALAGQHQALRYLVPGGREPA